MKWFQVKEHSAGKLRLKISFYIYKLLGIRFLYIIAFFVSFFTFVFQKDIRNYSKKYLEIVSNFTNIKPNLINQFKHCYYFAKTLCDKIEIHTNNFPNNKIHFLNRNDKKILFEDIDAGKGVFFICSHLGSIDVLKVFMKSRPKVEVNIFSSDTQSKIFNQFVNSISEINLVNLYNVDNIGIETTICLKDSLDKGNIAFIAGDRISQNNYTKSLEVKFLGQKVKFPIGVFKLAQLMEVPIYFIIAINNNNKYNVIVQRYIFDNFDGLINSYIKFLENNVKLYPLQFYHFYDIFS